MRKYAIIIEKAGANFSAYVPDLPGGVTTGKTLEEIRRNMKEAIGLHLWGMKQDNEAILEPGSAAEYVEVSENDIQGTACSQNRQALKQK